MIEIDTVKADIVDANCKRVHISHFIFSHFIYSHPLPHFSQIRFLLHHITSQRLSMLCLPSQKAERRRVPLPLWLHDLHPWDGKILRDAPSYPAVLNDTVSFLTPATSTEIVNRNEPTFTLNSVEKRDVVFRAFEIGISTAFEE